MFKTSLSRVLFVRTQIRGRGVVFATLFITAALLVLGAIAALQNHQATAAPTSNLNFQARLKQSSGALVPDGYYHVEFKLYNQSSTGSALWTETYTGGSRVRVVNGYVSVSLGSVTPFPGTIDWGEEHWITMNIGGSGGSPTWDGEMSPRLKLTAVPYAFKAAEAGSLKTTQGANQSTLGWATQTQSRALSLPDESGVLCVQNSTACGFAPATGGTGYIQNGTVQQPATSFNIDGTGTATTLNATTAIQLNGADINEAGTLTNVAYLNAVTTFRAVTNDTNAFRVQNSAGGTILNVDTLGSTVSIGQSSTSDVFTALANPVIMPTGNTRGVEYSPDSQYLVVTHWTSPYITIYKRSGDTFTKLANPTNLPTGNAYSASFSPDGQYLSIAHHTSPYITIYKRSGDTFTKLANPTNLPTGNAYSASFSPDGRYILVGHDTAPYITIYKRSGDTLTKLANSLDPPTGIGWSTAFSPDGQYASVAHPTAPYITIYKRSGDTFTKLANPTTLPTGEGYGVSFSPDGIYMSVGHATAPYLTIYKRSGDTFTKLSNPSTSPGSTGTRTKFSPNGLLLMVTHQSSPHLSIYSRSGDTFTKMTTPTTVTGADYGYDIAFSPDSSYVSAAFSNGTPNFVTYKLGNGKRADLTVQGNAYFAGQIVSSSLATGSASANAATFGSLAATSASVQNMTIADHLTIGGSLTLGSSDTAPGLLKLGVMNSVTDPASAPDGSMYYSSSMQQFRCKANGAWDNCGGTDTGTTTSFAQNGNALGETAILGTTDNYGLQLITNGTQVANFTSAGDIIFTPGETFEIKNSTNTTVLGVNTTDNTIDLNADVTTTGSMSITNGLTVAGNASFDSNLTVAGTTTMTNNLTVQNEDDENILNVNAATGVVTVGEANASNWEGGAQKLTDPAVTPTGTVMGVAFSNDDSYFATAHANSPYLTIYKRSGDTFTKLANPAELPSGTGHDVAWSSDSIYLAFASQSSPYLTIYKRSGDTFTKLANPVQPANAAYGLTWSSDGVYLSVTHANSPYLTIYKRSGDTFTKLANPTELPTGTGNNVSFSPDGTYMAVAHDVTPYLTIYKRSGDTFTKLANPSNIPPGHAKGIEFSYSGDMLAVSHDNHPFITIYKRSGDTFTKLANPSPVPYNHSDGVSWARNDGHLAVMNWGVSPYINVYKRSGDTFTKLAAPTIVSAGSHTEAGFSASGQYLAVGNTAGPSYMTIYRAGTGTTPGNLIIGGTTTTDALLIGNPASASLAGAKLVVTTAEIQTSLRLGNATSGISWNDITTGSGGGKLRLYGDSRNLRTITLTPEYAGAVLSGSGTGTMTTGYDSGARKTYYRWTSSSGSAQTYDIVVRANLPSDWSEWQSGSSLCVDVWSNNIITAYGLLTVKNTSGTNDISSSAMGASANNTWRVQCFDLTSAQYTADGMMTITLTVSAQSNDALQLGPLTLNYLSSF